MTAVGTSRPIIHCCDCGKYFSVSEIATSDLTALTIKCPHCGRNGSVVKECKR